MKSKRDALTKCRDVLLGPQDTRDNRRIWFEEQSRASEVNVGTRCYGLSNMLEKRMNTSGPPAAFKIIDGELDAVQLAVKETLRVRALALSYIRTRPHFCRRVAWTITWRCGLAWHQNL